MNPVSSWLQKRRVEREMAAEIAEHLAEKIDQLREEGHSEEEARTLARQFGNTTLQQEDSHAAWGWNTVEQFWQDTRFGWRVLAKTPAFTATAVIVLALVSDEHGDVQRGEGSFAERNAVSGTGADGRTPAD